MKVRKTGHSLGCCVRIGGIGLEVSFDDEGDLFFEQAYRPFFKAAAPDVRLKVHPSRSPLDPAVKKIFDSGGYWSLSRAVGRTILDCYNVDFGPHPYKTAVFSSDFRLGDIYLNPDAAASGLTKGPLSFPFDEVFFINLLSQGLGILVHGSGLLLKGRGFIFLGNSGAGKSTTARIWKKRGARVFSDDRLIIRQEKGRFVFYGTPWHGDVEDTHPGKVSLRHIFFLRHARKNYLKDLSVSETVAHLLRTSFVPFWDEKGMEFVLNFSERLARSVPARELGFVPDESAVDFVLRSC